MVVTCRFLGRSCLELITLKGHFIIDPNYLLPPTEGISRVFFTQGNMYHFDPQKIKEIQEKYSPEEEEDLEIYGPTILKEETEFDIRKVKDGKTIGFEDTNVEIFGVECKNAEECFSYVFTIGEVRVLHTADSAHFSDRLRNFQEKIDFCFISCEEENFDDYLAFLQKLNPKVTFPYHFIEGEEDRARKLVEYLMNNGLESSFLEIGDEFEF
jgi:L-ascorbate metabolism protein UlaG (beta-lactamase superfamily)